MLTEKQYVENAEKIKAYLETHTIPEDFKGMLYTHLEYAQIVVQQLQKTAHNSDYEKCCQASIYFRDMLDPLVTKCPICGNTIA